MVLAINNIDNLGGRIVNIIGAILSNTGEGSYTKVHADCDVKFRTGETSNSQDITWDPKIYRRSSESDEVGSRIIGGSGTAAGQWGWSFAIVGGQAKYLNLLPAVLVGGAYHLRGDGGVQNQDF